MKIKNQGKFSKEAIATMACHLALEEVMDFVQAKFPNKDQEFKKKLVLAFIKTDRFLERGQSYMSLYLNELNN